MMSNGDDSSRGRLIPLTEWIALSAFLESRHEAAVGRSEAQLAYTGRAAVTALLLVDWLDASDGASILRALQQGDIMVENIALQIGVDSDTENLKNSPELLASALESVDDVHIHGLQGGLPNAGQTHSLPAVLQKLGRLLYHLFSRGKAPPETRSDGENGESHADAKNSTRGEGLENESDDDVQPGAEKGRQKRFIGQASKSLRRLQISGIEDSLSDLSLPESISTLLRDLLEPSTDDGCAFGSLEEVGSELRQIVSQPEIFLVQESGQKEKLSFGESLAGRTEEVTCILEAAARAEVAAPSEPNTLVLIGGRAGSGKSFLVESIRSSLTDNDWIYMSCKFDRLMQAQPLSTIASAFEQFFRHIVSVVNDGGDVGDIVPTIYDNLSASGIVVLSELIPSLCDLYPAVFASIVMDDSDSSQSSEGDGDTTEVEVEDEEIRDEDIAIMPSADAQRNRLHYLFSRLVRAVARPAHPLFLWADDLQWIDESSLQLLSSLLTDSEHLVNDNDEPQTLLLVGSFRDNELDESHILSKSIEKFQASASVNVRNIHLDALPLFDATQLVSEVLQLPFRRVRSLTDVLYAKTLGNPLFLKVRMKSLADEKVIRWSLVERRWVWDFDAVKGTSIDDNVAVIMTRKMVHLPGEAQNAIKALSCFGLKVEGRTLAILLASEKFGNIDSGMTTALQEGILERDGEGYKFSHDIVQQAAYELMTREERGRCHFSIGVRLASGITRRFSLSRESHPTFNLTFQAADQINMSRMLLGPLFNELGDELAQIDFATLNRTAGERAMDISDFVSAMKYLTYGISFLPEDRWDAHYELSLRLHESLCLVSFVNGRRDKMTECLGEILQHSRCSEDKLPGLFVLIQSLASSGELRAAIEKILSILEDLGEPLPESQVKPATILDTLASTKKSLEGYSREDLISAPRLKDKRLHWAVRLMAFMSTYSFMVAPWLIPLIACRIVSISISAGICSESAFGFCMFGYCHITMLGDVEEGYRWGKLALSMLESCGAKDKLPKLNIMCHHMLFFWKEPLQSISAVLLQWHRKALLAGDIEYASMGAQFYCVQNILCGNPLSDVERECAQLASKMVQLSQLPASLPHLSGHQCVLRLIGSEDKNPFDVLGGYVNDEDALLRHALSARRKPLANTVYFHRLFHSFFFKRYENGLEYAVKLHEGDQGRHEINIKGAFAQLFVGLTAFHFIRNPTEQSNTQQCKEMSEKTLRNFRAWAVHSTWNWENKCMLLEAEYHFAEGDMEGAETKYEAAIESSKRHRFVHEEGLSHDLLSAFYTNNGNAEKAKYHVSKARDCYEKWGASALVELLDSTTGS